MSKTLPCPSCGHGLTRVIESRKKDCAVNRRRECGACSHRFSTREYYVDKPKPVEPLTALEIARRASSLTRELLVLLRQEKSASKPVAKPRRKRVRKGTTLPVVHDDKGKRVLRPPEDEPVKVWCSQCERRVFSNAVCKSLFCSLKARA